MENKCQCPTQGVLQPGQAHRYDAELELPYVDHEPDQCRGTNGLALYDRNGEPLWLCSNCNLLGDKRM